MRGGDASEFVSELLEEVPVVWPRWNAVDLANEKLNVSNCASESE